MSIFTPVNQVRLTNVSVVRLKKSGKRFEIACFKNVVLDYRKGLITKLDDVVAVVNVFTNVSKGQVAKRDDLEKCFKTDNLEEIVRNILVNGELQVSEKERNQCLDEVYKDVATIVADKTVHPSTKRPYTCTMIEKAMKDAHVSISMTKSAKQQALEVIKQLQDSNAIPIARAQMKVRVSMLSRDAKPIKSDLKALFSLVEEDDWSDSVEIIGLIEPGKYRELHDLVQKSSKGKGTLDLLSLKEVEDKETEIY